MQKYFPILAVLLISLQFTGCVHTKPQVKTLEERANYQNDISPSPRSGSEVKKAWLYPHEMPTGDYFSGSWLHLVVKKEQWNVKELTR